MLQQKSDSRQYNPHMSRLELLRAGVSTINRGEWRRCSKVEGTDPRLGGWIWEIFSHNLWAAEVARVLDPTLDLEALGGGPAPVSRFPKVPIFKPVWTYLLIKQLVVLKSNLAIEECGGARIAMVPALAQQGDVLYAEEPESSQREVPLR